MVAAEEWSRKFNKIIATIVAYSSQICKELSWNCYRKHTKKLDKLDKTQNENSNLVKG